MPKKKQISTLPVKPQSINIRQQKYKSNRIAGMNAYSAARAAGYSHAYSTHANERIDSKLSSLSEYLDQAGLTDKKLALSIEELCKASKVEKGGTSPDWTCREKGLKLALLAKKHLSNDIKVDQSQHITKIIVYAEPKGVNARNTSASKRVPAA